MRTEITDRMKKNGEIGRIAMLQLRSGADISDAAARFVAMTVENPDVGRERMDKDGGADALSAIWVLDDAEQMAVYFSDLEAKLEKAEKCLGVSGYSIRLAENTEDPFVLEKKGKDEELQCAFTLYPEFIREKQQTVVHFGVLWGAAPERSCTLTDMEAISREISEITRQLKRLNGLNIHGPENALKLAAFSFAEKRHVREAKARRQAEKKQRGGR